MHSETTESTWHYELLAWFEINKKRVIGGLAAIIAVILVIYLYTWNRERTEQAASKALLELRAVANTAESLPAASGAEFLKVARQYSSTSAGERALLLAAGALFTEGKYPEAQVQFEKIVSDFGESMLAPIAAFGAASSLDAQEKLDAALAAYQGVVSHYPNDAVATRAKLAAAGVHEAKNQPDQALKLYDEVIQASARSGPGSEASVRRERLLRKHPDLASSVVAKPMAASVKPAAAMPGKPGGAASVAKPAVKPSATNAIPAKR